MTQAVLDTIEGVTTVLPNTGPQVELIASGTLTQDFNDTISAIVSVKNARRVGLWLKHDGVTSQTSGYPVVLVQVSGLETAPVLGADSWYAPGLAESTWTAADIAAGVTLPTGADYTKGPVWSPLSVGGLLMQLKATDAAQDPRILLPPIDVTLARWMYVAVVQQGDTTNFGTASVDWNMAL